MQSTKPAKTNESTPRTNKGSRVRIPLVRPRKPVVPPLTRHRNDGFFRIQGRSGAMYYGPPPPRPHGGESPDHTKQAPSGSVMPEGACRGRRTGHGAGKLDKNRARRPSRSGLRVDSCARAVALTPHWPLCAPEPFQPSHAARQQVGAGEFEQKRQTAVAGPDG